MDLTKKKLKGFSQIFVLEFFSRGEGDREVYANAGRDGGSGIVVDLQSVAMAVGMKNERFCGRSGMCTQTFKTCAGLIMNIYELC